MISVKTKPGPPDGGYGWVIVIAASIGLSLIVGLARVSGFSYVEIIKNYGVSRAEASTIFMTARFVTFAATPIVSTLLSKYTYSSLFSIGGAVLFISLFLSAFATTIWQLVLTYGILIGISAPLIMTPGILAISMFFKKRRSFAMSLYFTIGGASGLVIPFLYEILLKEYRLSGAFFVYSALSLNICAFSQLIYQPNWLPPKEKQPRKRCPSSISENEADLSLINGNGIKIDQQKSTVKPFFQRIMSTCRRNITIFKDPVFLVLLSSRILISMTILNVIQFIPDFVDKDLQLGLTKKDIAILLSVTSIGDVCARFLTGTVIDKLPWRMKYTYGFLSTLVGVVVLAFIWVRSYALLLVLHILFGLLLGILIVMQHLIEADLMGLEKTPLSHGITSAMGGTASVIMMFVVGYVRDITGSYKIGFCLMGLSGVLAGFVWLLEPCLVRCLPSRVQPQPSIEKFPEGDVCLDAV